MISRRRMLQASTAAVATGIGLYTWQIEPHSVETVRRIMPISHLPAEFAGRTLVQLSDIHVGPQVSDAYVRHVFEMVRALEPDIVVYTGDFISHETKIIAHADEVYEQLPRGRLGTVGVLGNHDYGLGWSHPEIAAQLVDVLHEHGLHMLRNQAADIAGLQIVGLDDLWANRFDATTALASLDRRRAALVLSHNPDTVDEPGWDGYEGWILSGHTHGGQCKPPFLPPPLLPVRNRLYTSGQFTLANQRQLYISRGVGHLLQVRFNVRPEVTIFELQTA